MQSSPFDNLPHLSLEDALKILDTPVKDLEMSSDYYKAVFHLLKYPGIRTERALIRLIESESMDQAITIARKKAVEVLARLKCFESIPVIGKCLLSNDQYLVENAVWALNELGCEDEKLHQRILSLLDDPRQNHRVIIKSLSGLGVKAAIPKIKAFLVNEEASPSVLGASIVAISILCKRGDLLNRLEPHLFLPNQVDRYAAIQDMIDGNVFNLLPSILKSPVPNSYRLKALNCLWPDPCEPKKNYEVCGIVSSLIRDDPKKLFLLHQYDFVPDIKFLINEFFCTDFSRCYLALKTLLVRPTEEIWPHLLTQFTRFKKDYGALYFAIKVFSFKSDWSQEASNKISDLILFSLDKSWPEYMKFKPAAILTFMKFLPEEFIASIPNLLDYKITPFWCSRFATLMSIQQLFEAGKLKNSSVCLEASIEDPHRFVAAKSRIMANYL